MHSLVQPVPWREENMIGRVGGVPRRHREECPGLPAGRPSGPSEAGSVRIALLLLHSAARRHGDLTQGRGFASKRRPQLSWGPGEAKLGHPHLSPKGSPDAAAPHELPAVMQGGRTEPKHLPPGPGPAVGWSVPARRPFPNVARPRPQDYTFLSCTLSMDTQINVFFTSCT
ncbi:hypothetical protein NDU88_005888 [Pleurodeles waltl]|uniref:Uncharacterized protein n=1 Tax=Pleurodeles waltl TaxID=8319 RepID=A0AAV7TV81_PLEWA|nr:hypothetical protein NDU88_005888 [Pleurodeles waltl]